MHCSLTDLVLILLFMVAIAFQYDYHQFTLRCTRAKCTAVYLLTKSATHCSIFIYARYIMVPTLWKNILVTSSFLTGFIQIGSTCVLQYGGYSISEKETDSQNSKCSLRASPLQNVDVVACYQQN